MPFLFDQLMVFRRKFEWVAQYSGSNNKMIVKKPNGILKKDFLIDITMSANSQEMEKCLFLSVSYTKQNKWPISNAYRKH